MKRLLTLMLFLTSIHLSSLAQNEVFRIDSIPTKGILLDKGWKWHAGDNPDFAKPDFDDSKWESIDPTKDIMALEQVRKVPIGWFRLKILLNDSTLQKVLALVVKQTGATEFYLNGKLLHKFGKIDPNHANTQGYDPMGQAISLPLIAGKGNILAVRFAFPDLFLVKSFFRPNSCLELFICTVEQTALVADEIKSLISLRSHLTGIFKEGILLLFSLLHFGIFLSYTKQKANLYFGIYAFFLFLAMFVTNIALIYVHDLKSRNALSIVDAILNPTVEAMAIISIYSLLNFKRGAFFWVFISICLICVPLILRPYFWGHVIGLFAPTVMIGIGMPIICWKAHQRGVKGAYEIFIACILFLLCYPFYITFRSFFPLLLNNWFLNEIAFSISILALPTSMSYYLIVDFAANKKQIEKNFLDFQLLAAEKETLLLQQNAELQTALLQGQTIERKRVAADLHDSLGSTMSSLIYTVNAIDTNNLDNEEKNVYRHLKQMLDTAYNEIRLLSHNLLPEEFEKQGLAEALRHFVRKINQTKTIQFALTIDPHLGRLPPKTEFELYSICLELINNILKHAHATQASITLAPEKNLVKLTIADNGRGFFDNDSDGKGMKNVKARVDSLNGTWHTENIEGNGVCNEIAVPV